MDWIGKIRGDWIDLRRLGICTQSTLDFFRTSRDATVFSVVMNQLVAQDQVSLSMGLRVARKALFSELPFSVFSAQVGNIKRDSHNRQDKSQGLLRSRQKDIIGALLDRGQLDTVLIMLKTLEAGLRELRELGARHVGMSFSLPQR